MNEHKMRSTMLHQAIWNELYETMLKWDELCRRADLNQNVDKGRMNWMRLKIFDLCARLDAIVKQEGK